MDKRNTEQVQIDPKNEATNMYKHVVCEAMLSPNSIPVHQSEPFNINVEFIRISQDWVDLELLDKSHQVVEKIKINTVTAVELSNNSNPLSSSGGNGTPVLTRSNSILNRGALGSNSSSDDLLANGSPVGSPKSGSKASMLLGLDESESSSSSSSPKSSKKSENKNAVLSPKFGLLARSASNNLLSVNKLEKLDQPLSPTLSSSPSINVVGSGSGGGGGGGYLTSPPLNISGSSPMLSSSNGSLNSSNGSLSISPSNISSPRGGININGNINNNNNNDQSMLSSSVGGSSVLSQSIGGISISSGVSGTLHYNQGFSIITKNINYTFNALDRDGINHILNSIKMLALGRPHQEQLQLTFDAIVESLIISQTCKIPTIPPLPTSPPPPPPLLLVQITNKQSEA
ncbi:hypothetical protein ACTA71_012691 [Dictyostelium dimigraforme]